MILNVTLADSQRPFETILQLEATISADSRHENSERSSSRMRFRYAKWYARRVPVVHKSWITMEAVLFEQLARRRLKRHWNSHSTPRHTLDLWVHFMSVCHKARLVERQHGELSSISHLFYIFFDLFYEREPLLSTVVTLNHSGSFSGS